jgi:hypothetical protein
LIKLWALVISANVAGLLQIGLLVTIASVCGASFWFAKQSKLI